MQQHRSNTTTSFHRVGMLTFTLLVLCVPFNSLSSVEAFSARLSRPWDPLSTTSTSSTTTTTKAITAASAAATPSSRPTTTSTTATSSSSSSPSSLSASSADDNMDDNQDDAADNNNQESMFLASSQGSTTSISSSSNSDGSLGAYFSKHLVNGAPKETAPSMTSYIKPLFQLTRPLNFPGIVMLHALGIYLALSHTHQMNIFTSILLKTPSMYIVLLSLILTSSTSMVVNDYYDTKLGRDTEKKASPLISGEVTLAMVRKFLNYMYAIALICLTMVPGIPSRLAVVTGLMLTFWYTKHIKPLLWLKNVMCACLIALAPFASGSAALQVAMDTTTAGAAAAATVSSWGTLRGLWVPALWRLVGFLFFGVCGREIVMDITDLEDDQRTGVDTIPVHFGKRFASVVALICYAMSALWVIGGPVSQLLGYLSTSSGNGAITATALQSILAANTGGITRRLIFAALGGGYMVYRAIQVFQTKGENQDVIDRMVNQAQITMILCLVSFL